MLSRAPDQAHDHGLSVEERVRRLVAETAGRDDEAGALLDTALDSLTLLAIVTRIETAFAIAFDGDELVAALGARDVSRLAGAVARKVAMREANLCESAGNGSC